MLFHAYLLNLYPRRIFLYQLCFLGIFFLVLEHKRELTDDLLFIKYKHKKRCCAHMPPIQVGNQSPATTAIAGRHPLQSCWADGMRCGYTCWHCHAWHTLRRTNSDRGTVWEKKQKTDLITSSTIEGGRAALCVPPRTTLCSRLRPCRTLPRYGPCRPPFSSCPFPRVAAVAKRWNLLVGKIMVR